jgi:hypothetical protein
MKKVALTVAVLALGLAACGKKEENVVEANNVVVENTEGADMNAVEATNATENALSNAGNAVENAAANTENAAANVSNAASNAM